MDRVILQVPLPKNLKLQAEVVARDAGFSSLQEIIRVLLTKFAKREMTVKIAEEPEEKLSPKAQRRYAKEIREIKQGIGVTKTNSVEELLKLLRA